MKTFKFVKSMVVAAAIAVTSLSASTAPVQAQGLIEEIAQRGRIRVGLSTFVPWAMRDRNGELIGFEVDVARQLAEDMGVEVEFVPTAWGGIVPALLANRFDVIIGGLSITPGRNMTINFTRPYAHSGQQMAANIELAGEFTSLDDYNSTSVTLVCRRGATSCDYISQRFPRATLRQFDDEAQAYQEVANGNAHAIISSAPKPAFYTADHPDTIFMANGGDNLTSGNEGFGLRKGDPDALNFFSNWILYRTSDGWLQERHDYWFRDQSAWIDQIAAD
ncbi:transporter substrate-binding domain-containing protein [Pararhodobacter oceanensis]|uniref:transporter substrate-binding domain-containing protein n=1 Tax=Pararhodobacter oceanensis TaxID=2172121 RepID=UPI003A91EB86